MAAGDRLRELIVPDALAQAVTGGSRKKRRDPNEEARMQQARAELDALVAAVCPLCEGAVVAIDRPFVKEGEDTSDWAV